MEYRLGSSVDEDCVCAGVARLISSGVVNFCLVRGDDGMALIGLDSTLASL